jgi:hypothetical protein
MVKQAGFCIGWGKRAMKSGWGSRRLYGLRRQRAEAKRREDWSASGDGALGCGEVEGRIGGSLIPKLKRRRASPATAVQDAARHSPTSGVTRL